MTANLGTLATDLSSHQKTVEQLTSSLEEREEEYRRWKENYPKSEKELVDLRERKAELQEERAQVDVDLARVETQLQNINQQCMEQLQISVDEAAVGKRLAEASSQPRTEKNRALIAAMDTLKEQVVAYYQGWTGKVEVDPYFLTNSKSDGL